MQMTFLGTGSAFCLRQGNYQSNLVLTSDTGRRLLLDCGGDVRFSLRDAGLSHTDIDAVYVSHLHADHVGGLEYLGFSSKFGPPRSKPIRLITCADLVDDLWQHCLFGGMRTVDQGNFGLSDYFDVDGAELEAGFEWEGTRFELIPTLHVRSANSQMLSYALSFVANGQRVFFSSDSLFAPESLASHLDSADVIFHDCETSVSASGVHAHYRELLTLPPEVRAKTWLYHYNDGDLPDATGDGFAGFVEPRQVFDFSA